MDLISVIVPVYNVEKYLAECLESIINQTYRNLEIILVDDGSTDSSGALCDEYAQKDDRIYVIHKENGGLSSARNVGINIAKGKYLYFVDSDDYIHEELCERALNELQEESIDIVTFEFLRVTAEGKQLNAGKINPRMVLSKAEAVSKLISGEIHNSFCNKMFRKKVFRDVLCPEGYTWEDLGSAYKLFLNSEKICVIPDALYYYRIREKSITSYITEKNLRDIYFMQRQRYEDLLLCLPDVAELAFPSVALSAIRLHDRSLWKNVDNNALRDAHEYLEINSCKLLKSKYSKRYALYLNFPKAYNFARLIRHWIGVLVRGCHRSLNR